MGTTLHHRARLHSFLIYAGCLLLTVGLWYGLFGRAAGAQLGARALVLSNNEASADATYQLEFTTVTPGVIGSVSIEFCSNDPFSADPCTAPNGFDDSSAALISQVGLSGFTIATPTSPNQIILTRVAAPSTPGQAIFQFDGVKNPSASGSYFVRLLTYASSDASGPSSDYGGIAFAITNSLAISAEVPPYLIFCSAITIANFNCADSNGTTIDFGEFSHTTASKGSSQLLAATNAKDGYSITMSGTTMTSGSNIIPALAVADVSRPGVGQFGLNMKANTTPTVGREPFGPGVGTPKPEYSLANFYRFVSGDIIVSNPKPDNSREYTLSYIVNVPTGQAPGIYVSTLTYICLANF